MAPLESASAVAERLGIDLRQHRARALRRGCLADAGLVVGFEPSHAEAAVEVGGAARERVFLLLELPPLLEALRSQPSDVADARSAVGELQRLRMAAGARIVPSLPDPLGEPRHVVAEMARVIDAVTGALAEALPGRGAVSASRPGE